MIFTITDLDSDASMEAHLPAECGQGFCWEKAHLARVRLDLPWDYCQGWLLWLYVGEPVKGFTHGFLAGEATIVDPTFPLYPRCPACPSDRPDAERGRDQSPESFGLMASGTPPSLKASYDNPISPAP